jgi:hypothetical protein
LGSRPQATILRAITCRGEYAALINKEAHPFIALNRNQLYIGDYLARRQFLQRNDRRGMIEVAEQRSNVFHR